MNNLLIFFALPVATIILAVVLEKIIRCPILTALTFFAIYLIVTFAAFDATFLINTIVYTIIALISALIAEFFFNRDNRNCPFRNNNNIDELSNTQLQNISTRVANILSNNNEVNNNCSNNTAFVNVRNNNGEQTTWCCRRR